MSRDAFGPNLRRIRVQRGISIDKIAADTKVSAELLVGLEKNDFSEWPTGIYARAFIRQYAYAIGVDPDSTVDEFCRWFPQGDRRAERIVREHAGIVGHDLAWRDEAPRRSLSAPPGSGRNPLNPSHNRLSAVSLCDCAARSEKRKRPRRYSQT
jgi:transcriptional regulator with XRE-family HTH domain